MKIIKFLEKRKGYGVTLDDIGFSLIKRRVTGMKITGKFFLNNILRKLVKENRIKNIISKGTEFYYIE